MRLPAALGRSSTHPMALSVSQQKWRGNAVSVKYACPSFLLSSRFRDFSLCYCPVIYALKQVSNAYCFAGRIWSEWRDGKAGMWPWLPCVLHQAVALSEEHLPSLQDCCHQDLKYQLQARSVERGGIEKKMLFCTAHYMLLLYKHTIHSLHPADRNAIFWLSFIKSMGYEFWDPLVGG